VRPSVHPSALPFARPYGRLAVLAALLSALLLGVLAAACDVRSRPPIQVGTTTWPGYEPLYLAQDIGAYGPDAVQVRRYGSTTAVLADYRAGRLDAAALTLDEAMMLLGRGNDPCIVLVIDTSTGGDGIIAREGIRSVADLRGRRLGAERTALGAYVASRALQRAGLSEADVTLVNVPVDRHAGAFLSGAVDAVVTFEPVQSALIAAGGVQIFSSAEIPGEIVDVLVVNRAFLTAHAGRVRELVQGWFKALSYLERRPTQAAGYMSPRLHLMPHAVMGALSGLEFPDRAENVRMLIGESGVPGLAAPATRLAQTMRDLGLIRGDIKPIGLFRPGDAHRRLLALDDGGKV
jgi:NitT/TauT family transport system substrate-binding protein